MAVDREAHHGMGLCFFKDIAYCIVSEQYKFNRQDFLQMDAMTMIHL